MLNAYKQAQTAVDDLGVLFEFSQIGEATEQGVENNYQQVEPLVEELEFKSTLNGPEDQMPGHTLKVYPNEERLPTIYFF